MTSSHRVFFLPGASGDGRFWHPVAERLPAAWDKTFFDWPGLGRVPSRPDVNSLDDLALLVLCQAGTGPVDLVAQSMGGVVAMTVALAHPERVRRIVLTATSAGIDITPFEPEDWRSEYAPEFPDAASWILTERPNLSARLSSVTAPTLLVWTPTRSAPSASASAWPGYCRAPSSSCSRSPVTCSPATRLTWWRPTSSGTSARSSGEPTSRRPARRSCPGGATS